MRVLLFFVAFASALPVQQHIDSIKQESRGPCSVNVAGVQGNVNVTISKCTGIDPKFVHLFNEQIRRQSGQIKNLNERLKAEEDWFARHSRLLERLARPGVD